MYVTIHCGMRKKSFALLQYINFSEASRSQLRFSIEDLARDEDILKAVLILELELEESFLNTINCEVRPQHTSCLLTAVSDRSNYKYKHMYTKINIHH